MFKFFPNKFNLCKPHIYNKRIIRYKKIYEIIFHITYEKYFTLKGIMVFGAGHMRIRWHGHACFEISNDTVIVTDPHDGKSIGIAPPRVRADAILMSHDHFDHNSIKSVGGSPKVFKRVGKSRFGEIEIYGIPSFHDDKAGEKRGENTIFKWKMDDMTFCHFGDLGHSLDNKTVNKIGEVDVLFTPVGNVFTIDALGAWQMVQKISPKVVVPMHYRVGGLSLSIQGVDPFLKYIQDVRKVGNAIDFDIEDLPDTLESWVFSL